jgi:hypothetical protein
LDYPESISVNYKPREAFAQEGGILNVRRNTTLSLIDCGHLDFNDSKVIELHRCNLSDSDWNPWAGENVTESP